MTTSSTSRWSLLVGRIPAATAAAAAYAALAVGALWSFLTTPGMVGRHWDWSLPAGSGSLANMSHLQWSAWSPIGLGSYVRYRYGSAAPLFVLGLPGSLGVSGEAVAKSLIVLVVIASGLSMRVLTGALLRVAGVTSRDPVTAVGRFAAGAFYALSPFQYDQIVAGDVLSLVAYALAPLVIMFVLVAVDGSRGTRSALLGGVTFAVVTACSLQTGLFTLMAAVPLCFLVGRRGSRKVILGLGIAGGAWLLCSLYWLLPIVLGSHETASALVSTSGQLTPNTIGFDRYSSIVSGALGGAYFVPFHTQGLPSQAARLWQTAILAGVALAVVRLLFVRSAGPSRILGWYWVALYVLAVVVSSPGSVIGGPIRWLYGFGAWSLLFRTPQHLSFLVALCIPVIVALSAGLPRPGSGTVGSRLRGFVRDPIRWSRPSVGFVAALLTCAAVVPFFLRPPFSGYIGPFQEDRGQASVYTILASDTDRNARVMPFPEGASKLYSSQPKGPDLSLEAGDDGNLIWNVHPSITAEVKWSPDGDARTIQRLAYSLLLTEPRLAEPMLRMLAVKYVVVSPWYSSGAGPDYLHYSPARVRHLLGRAQYLTRLYSGDGWSLYANRGYDGRIATLPRTASVMAAMTQSVGTGVLTLLASGGRPLDRVLSGPPITLFPRTFRPHAASSPSADASLTMIALESSPIVHGDSVSSEWRGDMSTLSPASRSSLGNPDSAMTFDARSVTANDVPAIVFIQATGVSGVETQILLHPFWRTYTIHPAEMIPFGVPLLRDSKYIAVKGTNGQRLRVGAVRVSLGPAPAYALQGWFVEPQLYPATWNYFDPYPYRSFRLANSYSADANLSFPFSVAAAGQYLVAVLIHATRDSPPRIDWRVDGGTPHASALPIGREDLVPLELGEVSLSNGPHRLTFTASCAEAADPGLCDLSIYQADVTPDSTNDPGPKAVPLAEVGANDFEGRTDTDHGAVVVLRDTYDPGWSAVATRPGSTTAFNLSHQRFDGVINAWVVPAGDWQVRVRYVPQDVYSHAAQLSGASAAAILLTCLSPRRWRRRQRDAGRERGVSSPTA